MLKEKEIVCNNLTLLKYNEQKKKILKNTYSQILVIFRRSVYSYDNTA